MRPHYLVSRELPFVTTFMIMFGTAQEEGGFVMFFLALASSLVIPICKALLIPPNMRLWDISQVLRASVM